MNYQRVFTLSISTMLVIIASFTYAQAPASKAPPLIVGRWKLNLEKSGVQNVPAQFMEVREYRLRPDGFLVGLLITGNAQQGYHYLQFTAKSDGKDYSEYTDGLLADLMASGKQTPRTYGERIVDDYVTEWVDKVDGKVTAQGKKIISKDRKTMTLTVEGSQQQRVYDRQ